LIPVTVMPKPADFQRVKEEIRAIIRTKTRAEWEAVFRATDACVEPVLGLAEALEGELARGREMVVAVPVMAGNGGSDDGGGERGGSAGAGTGSRAGDMPAGGAGGAPSATVRQLANPVKFSRTPVAYPFAGVKTGTHNREVLMGLGYTEAQIGEFTATGLFD
ncbi:MAG TPA: CoA transferase, partial [Syntrophales bacterium]|nr:CoA transferase [Syntrophales bacterium]HQJ31703.1 CoA transferase [Syntrophales bacterium]